MNPNAYVSEVSQVKVLQTQLAKVGITHNADTRVNVPLVRVRENLAYFCNVGQIGLVNAYGRLGDGGPLPMLAKVKGLPAQRRGEEQFFNLMNARVVTNGRIHLIVDNETQLVPARAPY